MHVLQVSGLFLNKCTAEKLIRTPGRKVQMCFMRSLTLRSALLPYVGNANVPPSKDVEEECLQKI